MALPLLRPHVPAVPPLRGAIAAGLLLVVTLAGAQLALPVQPPKEASQPDAAKSSSPIDPTTRLAEVRAMLSRLEQPSAVTEGSPPGTPDPEIGDRMRLLRQLERSLAQRIDGEQRLPQLVRIRREAETRADNWHSFADPPPYSLPFVDSLEQTQETIEQQIATIDT